jgi:hypothetical protein
MTRLSSMSWSLVGDEKKDWRGGGAAHDPCAGFVYQARRGSEASFQLCQGCETSLKARFVDINDLSLFDVLHPSRVPKPEEPTFDDFGVQQVRGLLEIYGKDISKGGHRYPVLLSGLNFAPV